MFIYAVVPHDESQAEGLPAQISHIVDAVFVRWNKSDRLIPVRIPAVHPLGDRLHIPEGECGEEHLAGSDIHMVHIIVVRSEPAVLSGGLQVEEQRVSGLIIHPHPVLAQGEFGQNFISLCPQAAGDLPFPGLSRQLQEIGPVQMGLGRKDVAPWVHPPDPGHGHREAERLAFFTGAHVQAAVYRPLLLKSPRPQGLIQLCGLVENMGVVLPNGLSLGVSPGDLPALPALQIAQPQIPAVAVPLSVGLLEGKGQISSVRGELQSGGIPVFEEIGQPQLLHVRCPSFSISLSVS